MFQALWLSSNLLFGIAKVVMTYYTLYEIYVCVCHHFLYMYDVTCNSVSELGYKERPSE